MPFARRTTTATFDVREIATVKKAIFANSVMRVSNGSKLSLGELISLPMHVHNTFNTLRITLRAQDAHLVSLLMTARSSIELSLSQFRMPSRCSHCSGRRYTAFASVFLFRYHTSITRYSGPALRAHRIMSHTLAARERILIYYAIVVRRMASTCEHNPCLNGPPTI